MNLHQNKLRVQVLIDGNCILEDSFDRFPIVFGRSKDCHLCLKDYSYVSRSHGSIAVEENNILVTDLNSSHGILFGKKLEDHFYFKQEGSFQIKNLTFNLKLENDQEKNSNPDLDKTLTITAKVALPKLPSDIPILNQKNNKINLPSSKPVSPSEHKNMQIEDSVPFKKSPASKFLWERIDFSILPDPEIRNLGLEDLALQGALIWQDEIYDIRNFDLGDRIKLGPSQTEPLYIPTFQGELDFGCFKEIGAQLTISKRMNWSLYRDGVDIPRGNLLGAGSLTDISTKYGLIVGLNEVVSLELGFGMQFRLRYVPIPRPLVKKTWIENRDEFNSAITISIFIHLILSFLAIALAPKSEGPKIKNMPQRFAKLLIEPPKQTFAFEPPPPPPIEVPIEVPKEAEEKKVEKKIEKIKKIQKPKPVLKSSLVKAKPKEISLPQKPQQVIAKKQASSSPPIKEKSAEQDLENLFNSMPTPPTGGGGATKSTTINIKKGPAGTAKSGIRVSGLGGSESANTNTTVGLGLGGASGKIGYAQAKNSKAGKQGVAGAVIGRPSFTGVSREQGLTNEEVMKVVNQILGDVHRCYERALFNDSNIVGRVEYEWEINPNGSVSTAAVKRSEVANGDFLNSCVMGVFKKMKFPAAKNGKPTTASIGFPFGKN